MSPRLECLDPLPDNVRSVAIAGREWAAVRVDVTEFHCAGRVCHRLGHESETRLSVVLDEAGSPCEPRRRIDQACPGPVGRHMSLAPAGMELWGYSEDTRYVKDATLTFDPSKLCEQLAGARGRDAIATPRLRFSDGRIWPLVKLLADAVNAPDPSTQLYGDGLITAITALLFAAPAPSRKGGSGLAPWQLRRVVEYLDAHLPERIELGRLAAIAGLSLSHFSRAFKASTGMAPYHWQIDARIRRAQALLIDTHVTLDEVAEATGFADAVHFGRTFRKLTGATPAAWRNGSRH